MRPFGRRTNHPRVLDPGCGRTIVPVTRGTEGAPTSCRPHGCAATCDVHPRRDLG